MNRDHCEAAAATLGAELVRARLHRGLTQRGLAAKAGLGRVTLANLEAGRGSVRAVVAVLGVLEHRFAGQPIELELGQWIAQSRKSAGLSQDRLCPLAGVSKPAQVRVERGEGNVATLLRAMTALGLSMTLVDVAMEPGHPPPPTPTASILHGDCREHMREFARQGALFDAIVCDPPYHLSIDRRFGKKGSAPLLGGEPGTANPYRSMATGFMGQGWDGGDIAFDVETWRAAYAVLKPGGYIVAFGGTRTFHRLAVAIEDAGFEIRDTIMWVFGSGFPKSRNLKGKHNGQGTALKPAYEPILIARRPIRESSVAANVLHFGTGSINIDACRVPTDEMIEQGRAGRKLGASVALTGKGLPPTLPQPYREALGRWPANVIHDGIEETWGRYFYAAKASKADRGTGNGHPTVKPSALMRYLVRLVTPPGGTVFDPFTGSGSTGVAALQEGFSFIGCEQQADYIDIAERRLSAAAAERVSDVRLHPVRSADTVSAKTA